MSEEAGHWGRIDVPSIHDREKRHYCVYMNELMQALDCTTLTTKHPPHRHCLGLGPDFFEPTSSMVHPQCVCLLPDKTLSPRCQLAMAKKIWCQAKVIRGKIFLDGRGGGGGYEYRIITPGVRDEEVDALALLKGTREFKNVILREDQGLQR